VLSEISARCSLEKKGLWLKVADELDIDLDPYKTL